MTADISGCIFKELNKIGEFCVAILILKMEQNIFGVLWFTISRKVKTQLKCKKRLLQCMEKVLWLIEKWFVKFCARDVLLDSALWSSRPIEVDDDQGKTLTENNQCYTMQQIADTLKISKSIKLLVKMKNVSIILPKKLNELFGQSLVKNYHGACLAPRSCVSWSFSYVFEQQRVWHSSDKLRLCGQISGRG